LTCDSDNVFSVLWALDIRAYGPHCTSPSSRKGWGPRLPLEDGGCSRGQRHFMCPEDPIRQNLGRSTFVCMCQPKVLTYFLYNAILHMRSFFGIWDPLGGGLPWTRAPRGRGCGRWGPLSWGSCNEFVASFTQSAKLCSNVRWNTGLRSQCGDRSAATLIGN
jgi:hypothetical protein